MSSDEFVMPTTSPAASRGLIVEFWDEPVEDPALTKKEGRLICNDVLFVSIRIPGEIDQMRRPATTDDKERFPAQFEAYKKKQPQECAAGTPLTKWPGSPPASRIKEAAYLGIHTVEQLAAVSDSNLPRLGVGWRELRQKAIDYLAAAKDSATLFSLRTDNDSLAAKVKSLEEVVAKQAQEIQKARDAGGSLPAAKSDEMESIKAQLAALAATMAAAPANGAPKRRGRPPKAKPAEPTEA